MKRLSIEKILFIGFPTGVIMLFSMFLYISGIAQPFIPRFALDSSERLYIGYNQMIAVYDDGQKIASISPQTSRGYSFTINPDDTIFICTGDRSYLTDLDGNILETYEDINLTTNWELQYKGKSFTNSNGDIFKVRSSLGYTKIVKNGTEVIFRISLLSFIVKLLIYIAVLVLIFVLIVVVSDRVRMLTNYGTQRPMQ